MIGWSIMTDSKIQLLCVLLVTQIYNDIRMIVREELERAKTIEEEQL